jgi:hypothetical protein
MLPIVLILATVAVLATYNKVASIVGYLAFIDKKEFSAVCTCLLIVFLSCCLTLSALSLRLLPFRGDVTYPESAVIQTGKWSVESGHLYPALETTPYTPAPYGPLFYAGVNLGTRLGGGDDHKIRLILRSVVFLSYLCIPFLVYFLLRRLGLSRMAASLGASAAISTPIFLSWNTSVRPDLPALALSLFGMFMVARKVEATASDYFVAGLACTAAVLLKQSFLDAPLAIAVFTIVERHWRHFAVFSLTCLAAGIIAISGFLLHGEPVLREMFLIAVSPLDFRSAIILLGHSLSNGLGLIVIPVGFVGFILRVSSSRRPVRFLSLAYLFAGITCIITVLQAGGDRNYFFNFWVLSSIMAALALPEFEEIWRASTAPLKLGLGIPVFFLIFQQADVIRQNGSDLVEYRVEKLRSLHVLSTLPFLTIQGKDAEFLDTYLSAILEEKHRWSPVDLLREIDQQRFDVVFVAEEAGHVAQYRHQSRLSRSVVEHLADTYQPLCRTAKLVVLKPRDRIVSFDAADASDVLRDSCALSAAPLVY